MDWLGNHWGDLVSILGLVVSVGGFSIAIAQIVRSRKAAEAAEHAALETREGLSKNLTIADLVRASERIEELKRLHRENQWALAISRYQDVRLMLRDVRAQHPKLTREQQRGIQNIITEFVDIESEVNGAIAGGRQPTETERIDIALLRAQSVLNELASDLKQSV